MEVGDTVGELDHGAFGVLSGSARGPLRWRTPSSNCSKFRTSIDRFVAGLAELRNQRGHLIGLKELRYADLERIDRLEAQNVEQFDELSGRAVDFLVGEEALRPYHTEIDELVTRAEAIEK
ncbi:MAG: hypothetical protein GY856_02255, partial [bacterium]|nr:hypothetical protein [bacterium]